MTETTRDFHAGRSDSGVKQTNRRAAAALIKDALSVLLQGYWGEGMEDYEKGNADQDWMSDVSDEMQKILNPMLVRLDKITKDFHVVDILPVYETRGGE